MILFPFPITVPQVVPAPPADSPAWLWAVFFGCALLGKLVQDGTFRRRLESRLGKMERRDEEQQDTIDRQELEIAALERKVTDLLRDNALERHLKHFYRTALGVASNVIHVYRRLYGRDHDDTFEWTPEQAPPPMPAAAGDVQAGSWPAAAAPPIDIDAAVANRGDFRPGD